MARSNTIKEFLIGLGVDINENDVRRFFSTVKNMTEAAGKLYLSFEAIVTGLKAALIATASALEHLYYIAQRATTTVDNLKAMQYGLQQIGLSAGEASSILESLAMAMRLNPGNESLLNHLGIATRLANGAMKDTTQIEEQFVAKLSKMPFYIAAQYAEMFGISSRTLYQLLQNFGQLQAKEKEWHDIAKQTGVDLQESARTSVEFMNGLRGVIEVLDLLWIKVSTVLMQRLKPQMEEFRQFLLAHASDIENFGVRVGTALLDASESIIKFLPQLNKMVEDTVGWEKVLNAIGDIIIYRIFGPLGLVIALMGQLKEYYDSNIHIDPKDYSKIPGIKKDEKGNLVEPGLTFDSIWESFKRNIPDMFSTLNERLKDLSDTIERKFEGSADDPVHRESGTGRVGDPGFRATPATYQTELPPGSGPLPQSFRDNLPVGASLQSRANPVIDGLMRVLGLTKAQASGITANLAGESGIQAIQEGGKAPGTGGFGWAQWTGSRRHEFEEYAKQNQLDIKGFQANFGFLIKELTGSEKKSLDAIRGTTTARQAAERFMHLFERPANDSSLGRRLNYADQFASAKIGGEGGQWDTPLGAGGGGRTAQAPVTIHQDTDIHVHGSEPHSTGREVNRSQDQVNASLVRAFRSAVIA